MKHLAMTQTPCPTPPDFAVVPHVMNLALAYLVSRSLHAAAELRLADLLPAGGATPQELAAAARTRRAWAGCCARWPRTACSTKTSTAAFTSTARQRCCAAT
jgi:hypothetical protein